MNLHDICPSGMRIGLTKFCRKLSKKAWKTSNLQEFLHSWPANLQEFLQNCENLFVWYLSLDLMAIFHTEFEALTVTEDEVSDGLVLPTRDSDLQQDGTQAGTQEEPKASVLLPGDFFEEIENETGILGSRRLKKRRRRRRRRSLFALFRPTQNIGK